MATSLCIFVITLQAQTTDISVVGGNSGSPYSAFGIGNLLLPGFGQSAAFSGMGVGLANPYFVNTINPASLTSIERPVSMIFDVGINFSGSQTIGEETSPWQFDGGLSAMNLWFRFSRLWSSSLGLQPYSEVGYNIVDDRYDLAAGGDYQILYAGKGGVNRLYWSNAFQITPHLSAGLNLNLLFGTIEETQVVAPTGYLDQFSVNTKEYLQGTGYDLGLQYKMPMGSKELVLGFTYGGGVNLNSEKNSQLFALQDTLEQSEIWEKAYQIPHKISTGMSFRASKRLLLAADVSLQPWSKGQLSEEVLLKDSRAVSFGVEFIPSYDKYFGYYQQTLLRAGFRLQNGYLEVDGDEWYDWQASLGIALPFNRFRHHLNLTYSYQHLGNARANDFMEVRHQISVNVSLRDVWFNRPKLR